MGVANLKLVDAGIPASTFALLTLPSLPFLVILPFAMSRYLTGYKCMHAFLVIYYIRYVYVGLEHEIEIPTMEENINGLFFLRLIVSLICATFMFFIPYTKDGENALSTWHYWAIFFIFNMENVSLIQIGHCF